jgi:hypothetical protein
MELINCSCPMKKKLRELGIINTIAKNDGCNMNKAKTSNE